MQSIFGTDGIRGKFDIEISSSLAFKVGYALGMTRINDNRPILIGRDTRLSGELLLEALKKGLNSANKEIIDIGICPTPAVSFLVKELNLSCGIMISASHNPPEYNGIKIFDQFGKKLNKGEETILEEYIKSLNKEIHANQYSMRNRVQLELLDLYENQLIKSAGNTNLTGMKIILDTCHGSATSCAENIFRKLGANIKVINSTADGSKINVKCGSTDLKPLKKAIREYDADMGFSFDGDADRVIGVDSLGNILDGDHILFLWGRELMNEKNLNKNILITTEMANLGFENCWKDIGGIFYRTSVGDKFIYEEIQKRKSDLGGEQSGHILSKFNDYCGDGIFTAIQISKYCKNKGISLNTWLKSSFSAFPQTLTNISLPNNLKNLNEVLKNKINSSVEKKLEEIAEPCRIYVRESGTEPLVRILVEAEHKKLVDSCSMEITRDIETILLK